MIEKRVKLVVLGFSFNQTKTAAYGLVLSEEEGQRRLMVVIGTPEAQSIAFNLQGSEPPRPLTHDLMQALLANFGIQLVEVNIYKYDEGVFFSRLLLEQAGKRVELESRTSDAVGIALRTHSPIYTTEAIMQELGIVFNESTTPQLAEEKLDLSLDYSLLTIGEIQEMLDKVLKEEDYELASLLRDVLKKKREEEDPF